MRVLLVDDHPLFQTILSATVQTALGPCDLDVAATLQEALELANQKEFDLVFLDLGLPGFGGIGSLDAFLAECPDSRVVVVSAVEDGDIILAALEAGAAGYIPKTSQPDEIIAALKLVAAGGTYVPAGIQSTTMRIGERAGLSARQQQVLKLMLEGLSNRNIAIRLSIAENTVKHHLSAVYEALGTDSRAGTMAAAQRRGLARER